MGQEVTRTVNWTVRKGANRMWSSRRDVVSMGANRLFQARWRTRRIRRGSKWKKEEWKNRCPGTPGVSTFGSGRVG